MKRIVTHPAFWPGLALLLVTLIAQALAQAPKDKPRVPPGVDPGGVAVAIIGDGIDYTNPEVAKRLARDGEGEIIGWDFVDNDRRPYAVCNYKAGGHKFCEQPSLSVIWEYAPHARFVMARINPDQPQPYIDAIRFVAASPAKVVLIPSKNQLSLAPSFALEAARRYPSLLVISGPDQVPPTSAAPPPPNLLHSENPLDVAGLAAHELSLHPQLDPAGVREAVLKRSPSPPVVPAR